MSSTYGLKLSLFAEAFRLSRAVAAVEGKYDEDGVLFVALARAKIRELCELSEALDGSGTWPAMPAEDQ